MSCQVKRNNNNEIVDVRTPQGTHSTLYSSLLEYVSNNPIGPLDLEMYADILISRNLPFSDKEIALILYANTLTNEFKQWHGEIEPSLTYIKGLPYYIANGQARPAIVSHDPLLNTPIEFTGIANANVDGGTYLNLYMAQPDKKDLGSIKEFLQTQKGNPIVDKILSRTDLGFSSTRILEYVPYQGDTGLGYFVRGEEAMRTLPMILVNKNQSAEEKNATILHEIIHTYTVGVLESKPDARTPEEERFVNDVRALFATAKANMPNKNHYGLTNSLEFIAEGLANPTFQKALQEVTIKAVVDETITNTTEIGLTLWQSLMNAIYRLFGAEFTPSKIITKTKQTVTKDIPIKEVLDSVFLTYMDNKRNLYFGYGRGRYARMPDESYAYYAEDFVKENREKLKGTADHTGYTLGSTTLDSVTGKVIPGMKRREYATSDLTLGERKANKLFPDETTRLNTNMGDNLNKQEYTDKVNESYDKGIGKGTIFHKIIHSYFNRDEATQIEIGELLNDNGFTAGEFDWVYNNLPGIIYKTGTDYFRRTFIEGKVAYTPNVNPLDKIYTEVPLYSSELGMAGTADLLIDHSDDLYSLFDMKTGATFNRIFEYDMFKYGSTSVEDIFDTPRNRAKLQLMLYAIMLKVQRPDARFRTIELLHIKNRFSIYDTDFRRNINYGAYLEMIEKYLKADKPAEYAKLKALPHFGRIFDPSTYGVVSKAVLDKPDILPSIDLKLKSLRLQQLILQKRNLEQELGKGNPEATKILKEIQDLMNNIIELRKAPGMDLAAWDSDISWMDRWLGSPSSSTNPYVQIYYKQLSEAKDEAESFVQEWKREYDAKLKPVVAEYYTSTGLSVSEALGKMTKGYLGGINKQKLFAPLYKKEQKGEEIITTRLLTKNDAEFSSLTTAQQNFLLFTNESVAQFFVNSKSKYIDPRTGKQTAVANKVATVRIVKGEETELTNLDLYNGKGNILKSNQFNYYEGFLPKVYPTADDIAANHGNYSPEMLKFIRLKYTTNFYESMYDGWFSTDEAIPMKYLDNKEILDNDNFSTDLDHVMNNFVRQYAYKQYLDEVYAFGQASKLYLQAKAEADSNINYEKLVDWFENSIDLHVLGRRQQEMQMTRREWRLNTANGFKRFNWPKFLRSLKQFFAASTMWLKPIGGTANFVFASLYTLKEGIRSSVGTKIYGTDKDNQDFGIADIVAGFGAAFKMLVADAVTGSKEKNKLYLLMEKYRYFNDSYDWYTSPNKLVTAKNKLFSTKSMYFFHSFPEEIISAAIFYAQMSSMKTADGKSMLDHYEVKDITDADGNVSHGLVWDGYVRGERNTSTIDGAAQIKPVTELEPEEILAIRQVYERMHGGYKSDERVAAEYYVFGELMLQFKKYLPSIIKNGFASRGIRQQQGAFKANDKGELIWSPSVIEGRFLTLFHVMMNIVGMGKATGGNKLMQFARLQSNESYNWSELSREQKDNVLDAAVTMFFFALMMFGYSSLWDRDDEDATKKVYSRIMNDFAGQWYLPELVKNVINIDKPIVGEKSLKLLAATTELTTSVLLDAAGYDDQALTKQGNYRGWKEFQRNVPFLASWHDVIKFAKESENSDILEIRLK
jgi:hypothetical protein